MSFTIKRIILFSRNVQRLAKFYQDVFDLRAKGNSSDKEWIELSAGECSLAIHRGTPQPVPKGGPKVVFWAEDVTKAREMLIGKSAELGKVKIFGDLHLCDGKDPDGNSFQLSNRK